MANIINIYKDNIQLPEFTDVIETHVEDTTFIPKNLLEEGNKVTVVYDEIEQYYKEVVFLSTDNKKLYKNLSVELEFSFEQLKEVTQNNIEVVVRAINRWDKTYTVDEYYIFGIQKSKFYFAKACYHSETNNSFSYKQLFPLDNIDTDVFFKLLNEEQQKSLFLDSYELRSEEKYVIKCELIDNLAKMSIRNISKVDTFDIQMPWIDVFSNVNINEDIEKISSRTADLQLTISSLEPFYVIEDKGLYGFIVPNSYVRVYRLEVTPLDANIELNYYNDEQFSREICTEFSYFYRNNEIIKLSSSDSKKQITTETEEYVNVKDNLIRINTPISIQDIDQIIINNIKLEYGKDYIDKFVTIKTPLSKNHEQNAIYAFVDKDDTNYFGQNDEYFYLEDKTDGVTNYYTIPDKFFDKLNNYPSAEIKDLLLEISSDYILNEFDRVGLTVNPEKFIDQDKIQRLFGGQKLYMEILFRGKKRIIELGIIHKDKTIFDIDSYYLKNHEEYNAIWKYNLANFIDNFLRNSPYYMNRKFLEETYVAEVNYDQYLYVSTKYNYNFVPMVYLNKSVNVLQDLKLLIWTNNTDYDQEVTLKVGFKYENNNFKYITPAVTSAVWIAEEGFSGGHTNQILQGSNIGVVYPDSSIHNDTKTATLTLPPRKNLYLGNYHGLDVQNRTNIEYNVLITVQDKYTGSIGKIFSAFEPEDIQALYDSKLPASINFLDKNLDITIVNLLKKGATKQNIKAILHLFSDKMYPQIKDVLLNATKLSYELDSALQRFNDEFGASEYTSYLHFRNVWLQHSFYNKHISHDGIDNRKFFISVNRPSYSIDYDKKLVYLDETPSSYKSLVFRVMYENIFKLTDSYNVSDVYYNVPDSVKKLYDSDKEKGVVKLLEVFNKDKYATIKNENVIYVVVPKDLNVPEQRLYADLNMCVPYIDNNQNVTKKIKAPLIKVSELINYDFESSNIGEKFLYSEHSVTDNTWTRDDDIFDTYSEQISGNWDNALFEIFLNYTKTVIKDAVITGSYVPYLNGSMEDYLNGFTYKDFPPYYPRPYSWTDYITGTFSQYITGNSFDNSIYTSDKMYSHPANMNSSDGYYSNDVPNVTEFKFFDQIQVDVVPETIIDNYLNVTKWLNLHNSKLGPYHKYVLNNIVKIKSENRIYGEKLTIYENSDPFVISNWLEGFYTGPLSKWEDSWDLDNFNIYPMDNNLDFGRFRGHPWGTENSRQRMIEQIRETVDGKFPTYDLYYVDLTQHLYYEKYTEKGLTANYQYKVSQEVAPSSSIVSPIISELSIIVDKIVYGNGVYVGIGNGTGETINTFRAVYSDNGYQWTIVEPNLNPTDLVQYQSEPYSQASAHSNLVYVKNGVKDVFLTALKEAQYLLSSEDNGQSWFQIPRHTNIASASNFQQLCVIDNLCVGLFNNGTSTSEDAGYSWSEIISGNRPNYSINKSGNYIWGSDTGSNVLYRFDGISWNKFIITTLFQNGEYSTSNCDGFGWGGNISIPAGFGAVATDGQKVICMAQQSHSGTFGLMYSIDDCVTWINTGFEGVPWGQPMGNIEYSNKIWILYGVDGNNDTWVSLNGITGWVRQIGTLGIGLSNSAYNDKTVVTVGAYHTTYFNVYQELAFAEADYELSISGSDNSALINKEMENYDTYLNNIYVNDKVAQYIFDVNITDPNLSINIFEKDSFIYTFEPEDIFVDNKIDAYENSEKVILDVENIVRPIPNNSDMLWSFNDSIKITKSLPKDTFITAEYEYEKAIVDKNKNSPDRIIQKVTLGKSSGVNEEVFPNPDVSFQENTDTVNMYGLYLNNYSLTNEFSVYNVSDKKSDVKLNIDNVNEKDVLIKYDYSNYIDEKVFNTFTDNFFDKRDFNWLTLLRDKQGYVKTQNVSIKHITDCDKFGSECVFRLEQPLTISTTTRGKATSKTLITPVNILGEDKDIISIIDIERSNNYELTVDIYYDDEIDRNNMLVDIILNGKYNKLNDKTVLSEYYSVVLGYKDSNIALVEKHIDEKGLIFDSMLASVKDQFSVIKRNTWYSLKIKMIKEVIKVYFNERNSKEIFYISYDLNEGHSTSSAEYLAEKMYGDLSVKYVEPIAKIKGNRIGIKSTSHLVNFSNFSLKAFEESNLTLGSSFNTHSYDGIISGLKLTYSLTEDIKKIGRTVTGYEYILIGTSLFYRRIDEQWTKYFMVVLDFIIIEDKIYCHERIENSNVAIINVYEKNMKSLSSIIVNGKQFINEPMISYIKDTNNYITMMEEINGKLFINLKNSEVTPTLLAKDQYVWSNSNIVWSI